MDNDFHIVRREQSARSRQFQGVLTQVIYESDTLEILRTEMDARSGFDNLELGDFSAVHMVIEGTPVVRASDRSADLMPGDSIVFDEQTRYTITNGAPSRSVILSVLFKVSATEHRA